MTLPKKLKKEPYKEPEKRVKKEEIKEEKLEEAKEETKDEKREIDAEPKTEDLKKEPKSKKIEQDPAEEVEEVKEEKIPAKFRNIIKESVILYVKIVGLDFNKREMDLEVEGLNEICKMKYSEFSNMDAVYFKPNYILNLPKFPAKTVEYKNGYLWFSGKRYYDDFVKSKQNDGFIVEIVKEVDYGALCKLKHFNIYAELRNANFINIPFVRVFDVYKVGDEVRTKITDISPVGRITLELANKDIKVKHKYPEEYLRPGIVILGAVKSIQPFGCFVNIDVALDGICSIPSELEGEIQRGTRVAYRIVSVTGEGGEKRVRGKILGVVK